MSKPKDIYTDLPLSNCLVDCCVGGTKSTSLKRKWWMFSWAPSVAGGWAAAVLWDTNWRLGTQLQVWPVGLAATGNQRSVFVGKLEMWKECDRCLQLHSVDGVELVALIFKSSIQWISGYAPRCFFPLSSGRDVVYLQALLNRGR